MTTVQYVIIILVLYLTYNLVLSFPDSSSTTSLSPTISESTGTRISDTSEWTEPVASIPLISSSPITSTSIIKDPLSSTPLSRSPPQISNSPPFSSKFMSSSPIIGNSSLFSIPIPSVLVEASPSLPSLQSPDLDPFEERLNQLEQGVDDNLINLDTSEISPELQSSIEALYPFPEFQANLEDPITTIVVLKAVFKSDPEFLGEVISRRDDDQAVADGLKVPFEVRERLTRKTPDRNDDGDVVLFKGLAYAGLEGRSSQSLANIVIFSLTDFNQTETSPFSRPISVVRKYLERVLNNRSYLERIVGMDANSEAPISGVFNRRLLVAGGSNVQSFTCSYCFPKRVCKVCYWCKKKRGQ